MYHEKILDSNFKYIYNKFKTHKDLVNSLAKSKISICFSSDLTNPNHFEDISKITMRYFQSMICKCLILGNAPNDMKYLFNYNPVIEANLEKPIKQIEDILSNYNKYIDLIETNYNEVINKHKYYDRIKLILQIF
ncbi:MAG: hypothetical protein KatS3mg068_2185 [Candidatus Sericytochromatia bacterium]|nr:MAG: hypothetical protein KatS3mg068_2185 [Candidatus Sericytochromatia bacterium]